MKRYNPAEIEPKWQKVWKEDGTYSVDLKDVSRQNFYGFAMLPYPSGTGLHTGHVRTYTLADVTVRTKRQQGYNAYNPIGWDAFGLPAENYAIKTGTPPKETIATATARFREQLTRMGMSHDWDKEINTSDPEYYKWTQWVFTKLLEHDLAYQKESAQWWCSQCKTVLANEQVINGKCWRHDGDDDPNVTKKSLKQWFFKITEYADELLDSTDGLDWPQSIKTMQRNWIGRSEGAAIKFALQGLGSDDEHLDVFTTAHDTIFGTTFMVIAPEHPIVEKYAQFAENSVAIDEYVNKAIRKSELDREIEKQKSGVEIQGLWAINPINGNKIPVFIADYVLITYGTGAIMAVPGEDRRDYEFAKKYDLPIIYTTEQQEFVDYQTELKPNRKNYKLAQSGEFNGLDFETGRMRIMDKLIELGVGERIVQYKIRDWLISRQRYWGAPIPVIHCEKDGAVAVPEDQLPVILPEVESYQPTGGVTSVLAGVESWVSTLCPKCGGPGRRETDTMDGYACSSWYFMRYLDPHNDAQAWDPEVVKRWMPVDFYNGADHAVSHLLYARFWTHFFYKLGLVPDPEPVKKLVYNAYILASDGTKMSKSKGNVIDPLEVVDSGYGADALRVYEMFIAPYDMEAPWDERGVPGTYRFLNRVWNLVQEFLESEAGNGEPDKEVLRVAHKTIKKVDSDIGAVKLNTAVAAMMEAVNAYFKLKETNGINSGETWRFALESLVQLMAPFAPHIAEELWQQLGHDSTIHKDSWPVWDDALLEETIIRLAVQVNGKLRAEITLSSDADEAEVKTAALEQDKVKAVLGNDVPKRVIYIPGKVINIVV